MSSRSSSLSDRIPTSYTIPDPNSVEENGRTYHGYREGKYHLPNDGDEQDRLDIQHKLWFLMLRSKLYLAPIKNPKHVLDIGTGTGIWAIQFARQHPDAQVIGTDLSLIQPAKCPSNCTFIREDIEEDWIHQQAYDYVHWRLMVTCFNDHRSVIQKVYDNIAPGTWCEFHESTSELIPADEEAAGIYQTSNVKRFAEYLEKGLKSMGRDLMAPRKYKRWMEEMGFTDVVEEHVLMPINGWPLDPIDKEIGQFAHLDAEKFVPGTVRIMLAAGITQEELPGFLESVKYDFADARLRIYWVGSVVYGRKPNPDETGNIKSEDVKMETD